MILGRDPTWPLLLPSSSCLPDASQQQPLALKELLSYLLAIGYVLSLLGHPISKGYRKTPVKGSTVKEAATDVKHEQSV